MSDWYLIWSEFTYVIVGDWAWKSTDITLAILLTIQFSTKCSATFHFSYASFQSQATLLLPWNHMFIVSGNQRLLEEWCKSSCWWEMLLQFCEVSVMLGGLSSPRELSLSQGQLSLPRPGLQRGGCNGGQSFAFAPLSRCDGARGGMSCYLSSVHLSLPWVSL